MYISIRAGMISLLESIVVIPTVGISNDRSKLQISFLYEINKSYEEIDRISECDLKDGATEIINNYPEEKDRTYIMECYLLMDNPYKDAEIDLNVLNRSLRKSIVGSIYKDIILKDSLITRHELLIQIALMLREKIEKIYKKDKEWGYI